MPTRTHLLEVVDHLGYEIAMVLACADRRFDEDHDAVFRNALLESQLLHTRALIEFFLKGGMREDVRRFQIAPNWHYSGPDEATGRLNRMHVVLQRHLSHLTWHRVTDATPVWDMDQIAADVRAVARNWWEHLEKLDGELAGAFRQGVRALDGAEL